MQWDASAVGEKISHCPLPVSLSEAEHNNENCFRTLSLFAFCWQKLPANGQAGAQPRQNIPPNEQSESASEPEVSLNYYNALAHWPAASAVRELALLASRAPGLSLVIICLSPALSTSHFSRSMLFLLVSRVQAR